MEQRYKKLSPMLVLSQAVPEPGERFRLIIEVRRKTERVMALVESNQGAVEHELKLVPSLVVELPFEAIHELAKSHYVTKIWRDLPIRALLDVAIPAVGGNKLHQLGLTGKDVVAAVLDTGIFPHPDLIKPTNRIIAWNDFVNNKKSAYDDNGHGTHVAGILAGNGYLSSGRFQGIAPEAKLVGVKVLDSNGSGRISTVLKGIEWCLSQMGPLKIRVINFSMGTTAQESYQEDPLCRAVRLVWEKGIVVCTAAGNQGPKAETIDSPGISPFTITVGNSDDRQTVTPQDDKLNPTSSRGPSIDKLVKPDLVAPGTEITSIWSNGGYKTQTGTSMATPVVTGAAALILQKWPNYKPAQVKRMLLSNTIDLNLDKYLQGTGELNLENLLNNNPKLKMWPENNRAWIARLKIGI